MHIFEKDAASVWSELNSHDTKIVDDDLRDSFFKHFKNLGADTNGNFDELFLNEVESFLKEYNCNSSDASDCYNELISSILNQNFSIEEIDYSIDCLKKRWICQLHTSRIYQILQKHFVARFTSYL